MDIIYIGQSIDIILNSNIQLQWPHKWEQRPTLELEWRKGQSSCISVFAESLLRQPCPPNRSSSNLPVKQI